MRCRIAELRVDILAEGGIAPLCKPYFSKDVSAPAEITVRGDIFRPEAWPGLPPEEMPYMDTGVQFYRQLLRFDGLLLHASAVAVDGQAYLFAGASGAGKSTHTRLYRRLFGDRAVVFNDDKPALRRLHGAWYAYGTPWCGTEHINVNMRAPVAGICFVVPAAHNRISRLTAGDAVYRLLGQTLYQLSPDEMDALMRSLDRLVKEVPIFELENRPEPEAALLSFETMKKAAEEAG